MEKEELKETIAPETEEKATKEKKKAPKKWQEELEKAQAEAEESKRKWYAVTAEYENYRRRSKYQRIARTGYYLCTSTVQTDNPCRIVPSSL